MVPTSVLPRLLLQVNICKSGMFDSETTITIVPANQIRNKRTCSTEAVINSSIGIGLIGIDTQTKIIYNQCK